MKPFTQPQGVIDVQLDKMTNRLATPACPDDYTIAFVAGTEPHDTCDQSGGVTGLLLPHFRRKYRETAASAHQPREPATCRRCPIHNRGRDSEKKSLFGKIVGVFQGDSGSPKKSDKPTPAPSKASGSGSPPQ